MDEVGIFRTTIGIESTSERGRGDMTLLGARSLAGLNLRIDVVGKRFIAAGPIITGVAA